MSPVPALSHCCLVTCPSLLLKSSLFHRHNIIALKTRGSLFSQLAPTTSATPREPTCQNCPQTPKDGNQDRTTPVMHSRIWSCFFTDTEEATSDFFFLLVSLVECFFPSSGLSKHGKSLSWTSKNISSNSVGRPRVLNSWLCGFRCWGDQEISKPVEPSPARRPGVGPREPWWLGWPWTVTTLGPEQPVGD